MSDLSFPPEVWERAWRYASVKDLKSLASLCRLFHHICQPLLFQKLSFTGPDVFDMMSTRSHGADDTMKKMERKRERLLSIGSSTHIAVMVRSWIFNAPPLINFLREEEPNLPGIKNLHLKPIIDICYAIESDFRSTIGSYTNLSRLVITGFDCSPEFCQTLALLPNLSAMDVRDCDITCPASAGGIALKEFSYTYYDLGWREDERVHQFHLVSPSNLEKLEIMDPEPAKQFLSVFLAAGPAPHLVFLTLSVGYEAQDLFYRFLDCCPALKDIELNTPAGFADGVILPETSIPVLCSFVGRMEVASVLTPGRPIQKVYLNHMQRPDEYDGPVAKTTMQGVLLQISESTAVVEELTLPLIPLDSSILRLISEFFPKLKHLAFFLQNTEGQQNEETSSDEGSDAGWETVDGDSNSDIDEILNIQIDDENGHSGNGGGDWIPFTSVLQNMLPTDKVPLSSKGSHQCDEDDDCCDGKDCTSEYSDSTASISDLEGLTNEDTTVDRTAYKDFELTSYKDFMISLGNDAIPLPLNIRFLAIRQAPGDYDKDAMSNGDVFAVVEKLSARYPGLTHIVAGERQQVWKRRGGVWKAQKHTHPCTRYLH
ncbi:hypothetical protein C8R43DRAFT_1240526 [Mycena crocata]|nr:hypothetical protein C8R43DRAFT_1240526 [Mycena crocata]